MGSLTSKPMKPIEFKANNPETKRVLHVFCVYLKYGKAIIIAFDKEHAKTQTVNYLIKEEQCPNMSEEQLSCINEEVESATYENMGEVGPKVFSYEFYPDC